MEELKECPFCGGRETDDELILHKPNCYFVLNTIQTFAPISYSQDKLNKAWNTRAERTCKIINKYEGYPPTYIRLLGRCSLCGEVIETAHNYCFNCGAKVVN